MRSPSITVLGRNPVFPVSSRRCLAPGAGLCRRDCVPRRDYSRSSVRPRAAIAARRASRRVRRPPCYARKTQLSLAIALAFLAECGPSLFGDQAVASTSFGRRALRDERDRGSHDDRRERNVAIAMARSARSRVWKRSSATGVVRAFEGCCLREGTCRVVMNRGARARALPLGNRGHLMRNRTRPPDTTLDEIPNHGGAPGHGDRHMHRDSAREARYGLAAPCPGRPSRRSRRWHPGRLLDHWPVITSASFPPDLGWWNQDEHPYYLEVFGEVEPALDIAHAEVIRAGESDAATTNATPIYEYWWTIGHGGSKPEHRHLFGGRAKLDLWHRLADVAARVYLYFPISGGWRGRSSRRARSI